MEAENWPRLQYFWCHYHHQARDLITLLFPDDEACFSCDNWLIYLEKTNGRFLRTIRWFIRRKQLHRISGPWQTHTALRGGRGTSKANHINFLWTLSVCFKNVFISEGVHNIGNYCKRCCEDFIFLVGKVYIFFSFVFVRENWWEFYFKILIILTFILFLYFFSSLKMWKKKLENTFLRWNRVNFFVFMCETVKNNVFTGFFLFFYCQAQ